MKKKFKKLSLTTETLRTLGGEQLKGAAGGASEDTNCTIGCTLCTANCSACTARCSECTIACSICCI